MLGPLFLLTILSSVTTTGASGEVLVGVQIEVSQSVSSDGRDQSATPLGASPASTSRRVNLAGAVVQSDCAIDSHSTMATPSSDSEMAGALALTGQSAGGITVIALCE
jgi:hypothetical protein